MEVFIVIFKLVAYPAALFGGVSLGIFFLRCAFEMEEWDGLNTIITFKDRGDK